VLISAAAIELRWALPAVTRELAVWRRRALQIPDAEIRADALSALAGKRGHTDGAVLFSILAARRSRGLLRLLSAYELIWDFLDTADEHGARSGGVRNGRQLHLALVDALDQSRPVSNYYRYHPWKHDGGYLRALLETCREGSGWLASYELVRPRLLREAWHAQVLALNHDTDPHRRDAALQAWASSELTCDRSLWWFERTGAASASLTVHALLAIASREDCDRLMAERVQRAYSGCISAATTMLDSYADQVEDRASGNHSYISHYECSHAATRRVSRLLRGSLHDTGDLPDAPRHVLIVSCMAAMYLSKPSARCRELRQDHQALASAAGQLTIFLLPLMRLWRLYAKSPT
jgi:tetraprenyl-beta-curcumene synthase